MMVQTSSGFAVPAAVVVVGLGERGPICHVLLPIACYLPNIARVFVDRDPRSVLAGYDFVDETADLVPSADSRIAGAGIEVAGSGVARDFVSLACAPGNHVDGSCVGIERCDKVQACQIISLRQAGGLSDLQP